MKDNVHELIELNAFFLTERDGKDLYEVTSIQRLADALTAELVDLLGIELLRKGDVLRVQDIRSCAKEVDIVRNSSVSASALVEAKHKELQCSIADEHVAKVIALTRQLTSPDGLSMSLRQVVTALETAKAVMKEVPEKIPNLMRAIASLSEKVFGLALIIVDSDAKSVADVQDSARKLDAICVELSTRVTGTYVDALEPQLNALVDSRRMQVVPAKLAFVEAELAKTAGMNRVALIEALRDMSPWWDQADEEADKRLKAACATIESRVAEAFDKSLSSGAQGRLDALQAFAKDYDDAIVAIRGKSAKASCLVKALDNKRAQVTLARLLDNATKKNSEQTEKLRHDFAQAKAKVEKVPRELFGEIEAGSSTWRFKLRKGAFKDFPSETGKEVERLYQEWVSKGKPTTVADRRYELSIEIERPPKRGSAREPGTVEPNPGSQEPRPRCTYGEGCYRKNPEHRRDFCHPGDWDWEEVTAEASDAPGGGSKERFSFDFHLMTQVNLDRHGGMRNVQRSEGLTRVQKITRDYFGQVAEFIKGAGTMFSEAEIELRLLGEADREAMEKQVKSLLEAIKPTIEDFLGLAVFIRDTKAIDEVVALLGTHAEDLGIPGKLKELRLSDVVEELRQAYAARKPRNTAPGWELLRGLVSGRVLNARLALVNTIKETSRLRRRRAQMRCQALLSEYEGDTAYGDRLRAEAVGVLSEVIARYGEHPGSFEPEVVLGSLRAAVAWGCDVESLLTPAGTLVERATAEACHAKLQPLERIVEVLDVGLELAKTAHRPLPPIPEPVIGQLSRRVFDQISATKNATSLLGQVVSLQAKLGGSKTGFDSELWNLYKPWYEKLGESSAQAQTEAVEWAIAYCEQLKLSLPPWMMSKDQVEAIRKIQHALDSGDENELRKAVIFAKQADYKADAKLEKMYDDAISKLKTLKRLPAGWEVTELVGTDATEKMFKQADLADASLKALFQRVFDETKDAKMTRDRVGAVPRGYQVERIVSVMNAESWVEYLKRRDEIAEQCRVSGAAPYSADVWSGWSGQVATSRAGQDILERCKVPALVDGANEFLMFHGTKPEAADLIAKNHFNMTFACKEGLYGGGLYFAESCSKSDEYVKPDSRNTYPMILCRVTLGRINYCPQLDPITSPGREALERSCLVGGGYHSVLGDRKKAKGTYREFIVYDHFQVYPHFIVWYTRCG